MASRFFGAIGVSASAIACALSGLEAAQGPSPTSRAKPATKGAWTISRTVDGQPDLQGVWTNATVTPFERPPELAGKPFLTEAEVADIEKQVVAQRAAADKGTRPGDVGNYNQF